LKDYIAVLSEIPSSHSGLIFEQIARASLAATTLLRDIGMPLPGETKMPTLPEVREHLTALANRALGVYFDTKEQAPRTTGANEIWGEDSDDLFSLTVTGLAEDEQQGFTVEIDLNLLYGGE
jgi:hypothetical protein